MKVKRDIQTGLAAAALVLMLGACSQPLSNREKGALVGGGAGAAGGALIGGLTGAPGTGALIGGAAGAAGGALVGDERDRRNN
jgi:hypothetical protein